LKNIAKSSDMKLVGITKVVLKSKLVYVSTTQDKVKAISPMED